MLAMGKISNSQQQKWQAEADAHTLALYQEIVGNKARMNRAIKAANQKAADLTKRASIMKKVASKK